MSFMALDCCYSRVVILIIMVSQLSNVTEGMYTFH